MFHSRDSPRLLVCDTGLYLEENDIGFITVAICGGYISKYPRLVAKGHLEELLKAEIVSKSKLVPSVFIKTRYWIIHWQ